jgi:hypothetical protein
MFLAYSGAFLVKRDGNLFAIFSEPLLVLTGGFDPKGGQGVQYYSVAGWVIKPTADAFCLVQQTASLVQLL